MILSSEVISNFFTSCVLRNLNGENLRRGKTEWELGKEVFNPRVSVVEDPFRPWAAGTLGFDDEGVPTTRKVLVSNGVVSQFIYDTRTANLSGTQSTGNGFRSGFASTPSIGTTNVVVKFPKEECVELMDVPKGVFVKELMGFHNMNPITGDFALDVTQGFTIRDGELDKPIRGCMLVGNFLKIMEGEVEFGKEERGRSWFFTPRLGFKGKIVSK